MTASWGSAIKNLVTKLVTRAIRNDSREACATETPIFIARQADSHESLEFPIRADHPNRANRFVRITPLRARSTFSLNSWRLFVWRNLLYGGSFCVSCKEVLEKHSKKQAKEARKRRSGNGAFHILDLGLRQRQFLSEGDQLAKALVFSTILAPSALMDPVYHPLKMPL